MTMFDLTADEIGDVQRKRVRDSVEMVEGKCIDYPCCGHTDGLGCDWVSPNDNPALYFCGNPDHDYYGSYPWHEVGKGCPEEETDPDECEHLNQTMLRSGWACDGCGADTNDQHTDEDEGI